MKALILSDRVPVVPDALIFLDIDGVLNDHVPFSSGWCGTGSLAVKRLNQLLAFRPSAGVVLVSSWRYFVLSGAMSLDGLESLLMTHGLDIRGRLVGVLDADEALKADWDRGARRLALVSNWRAAAGLESLPWVVLDDSEYPPSPNVVKVCGFHGLTASDVIRASAILGGSK